MGYMLPGVLSRPRIIRREGLEDRIKKVPKHFSYLQGKKDSIWLAQPSFYNSEINTLKIEERK